MAVEITVAGLSTSNIKSFSVQEDATPMEPSSSLGGVGSITAEINEFPDLPLLLGDIALIDGARGKTSGAIKSINSSNGNASLTADSVLGLFNTERTIQPYVGTLGGAIQNYCDIVGITNDLQVHASVTARSVTYPGWKGNVWVYIKQILVREQVEMSLVFDRVYVRPLRALTATLDRSVNTDWTIDAGSVARTVEVNYYNHDYGTQREIYPLTTAEPTIYSVDAGATQVVQVQLNASVVSVNQPVVTDFVYDVSYAGTNGVYSVTGNDNLPITAAQWTDQGGSLTVAVTSDPSIIEITITGPPAGDYAPYRIAMSSGSGNDYNSLHITATAVTWDKQTLTLLTGATSATTSDEVSATVDNKFVSSLAEAYNLGIKAAQAHAGINYTLNGSALDINRSGDGRGLIQATILDFNTTVTSGTTITTFNATWAGDLISDFNAYWQGTVDGLFANQLFGNAIGARVLQPNANFRIASATTTENMVTYTATLDTLISDFSDAHTGDTIADFNAQFTAKNCRQFSIIPLRSN